jgi:hypothetical protein
MEQYTTVDEMIRIMRTRYPRAMFISVHDTLMRNVPNAEGERGDSMFLSPSSQFTALYQIPDDFRDPDNLRLQYPFIFAEYYQNSAMAVMEILPQIPTVTISTKLRLSSSLNNSIGDARTNDTSHASFAEFLDEGQLYVLRKNFQMAHIYPREFMVRMSLGRTPTLGHAVLGIILMRMIHPAMTDEGEVGTFICSIMETLLRISRTDASRYVVSDANTAVWDRISEIWQVRIQPSFPVTVRRLMEVMFRGFDPTVFNWYRFLGSGQYTQFGINNFDRTPPLSAQNPRGVMMIWPLDERGDPVGFADQYAAILTAANAISSDPKVTAAQYAMTRRDSTLLTFLQNKVAMFNYFIHLVTEEFRVFAAQTTDVVQSGDYDSKCRATVELNSLQLMGLSVVTDKKPVTMISVSEDHGLSMEGLVTGAFIFNEYKNRMKEDQKQRGYSYTKDLTFEAVQNIGLPTDLLSRILTEDSTQSKAIVGYIISRSGLTPSRPFMKLIPMINRYADFLIKQLLPESGYHQNLGFFIMCGSNIWDLDVGSRDAIQRPYSFDDVQIVQTIRGARDLQALFSTPSAERLSTRNAFNDLITRLAQNRENKRHFTSMTLGASERKPLAIWVMAPVKYEYEITFTTTLPSDQVGRSFQDNSRVAKNDPEHSFFELGYEYIDEATTTLESKRMMELVSMGIPINLKARYVYATGHDINIIDLTGSTHEQTLAVLPVHVPEYYNRYFLPERQLENIYNGQGYNYIYREPGQRFLSNFDPVVTTDLDLVNTVG